MATNLLSLKTRNSNSSGMSLEINSATVVLSHEAIHLMKFSYLHQLDVRVWEERGTIGMMFLKPGSPTLSISTIPWI